MKKIKGEVEEARGGIQEEIEKAKEDIKETTSLQIEGKNKGSKGGDAKRIKSEKESGGAES